MEEILNANKLLYSLPIGVDAVSNSTTTITNFNPNSYETTGGDTMFVQFPKTTTYLDAQNSYIKLKLKVQNVNDGTLYCFSNYTNDQPIDGFNIGASVMNLIDSVELISEGGQCLFKELFVNQMQTVREYRNNISRKNYLSFMGGIADNDRADPTIPENRYPVYDGEKDTSFYIPLTEIGGGFFNGVLIPDLLLSNAILKIKLANVGQNTKSYKINVDNPDKIILESVSTANNNAVLTNVALILSQKELYEEVRETINKKLKSPEGLEYSYYTNFNTSYVFENNTAGQDYKIPLNLSAGKIKYVAIKPTLPPIQGLPVIPLASAVWDNYYDPALDLKTTVSYNMPFGLFVRLGNNVLSTYEVKTIPEMYETTIRSLSNISYGDCQDIDVDRCINKKSTSCVSFYNYAKLDRNVKMQSDYGVLFAFNFDRVEGLNVSGLSTGIERLLEINVSKFRTNNTPTWYFQIQYLQTANIFADGQIAVNK
jgi:hypothetical protein